MTARHPTASAWEREARTRLQDAGLRGSFVVRDLDSGAQLALDPDVEFPIASLVKVPLALAVLDASARGDLDLARPVEVAPGRVEAAGPMGLSRFRHPATIAVDDLLYLSMAFSDNTAADALFELVPPVRVAAALAAWGVGGIAVRHGLRTLAETPAERLDPEEVHLAHVLAIAGRTSGSGHPVPQLDVSRANAATATSLVDLLVGVWRPTRVPLEVAARVRALMTANALRHRLAPDFASDASRWSSKTGTLLNHRHEMGVVEHDDGRSVAVVVLTESAVPASVQPVAEATMAAVARRMHDELLAR